MGLCLDLLGLVALPWVTPLTSTVPKLVPTMVDTSPDARTAATALAPARAAVLSAPVKTIELDTLTDPGTIWVMTTLTTALISAKMLASIVFTNCMQHQSNDELQSTAAWDVSMTSLLSSTENPQMLPVLAECC